MQGTEENIMADIKINDLNEEAKPVEEVEMTEEELAHVKGGIGLLLPAVQKVREAASTSTTTQKVLGDGSVRTLGDGSV